MCQCVGQKPVVRSPVPFVNKHKSLVGSISQKGKSAPNHAARHIRGDSHRSNPRGVLLPHPPRQSDCFVRCFNLDPPYGAIVIEFPTSRTPIAWKEGTGDMIRIISANLTGS